jgi:uncharacterized membrane protein (UPF0182 family)
MNAYPDQVGRLVKATGPITDGAEYYVPALSAEKRTRHGNFIPQSERVILSNSRETVLALADPMTNPQVREIFHQHNPIPGTIWQIEEDTHILENPDEIDYF